MRNMHFSKLLYPNNATIKNIKTKPHIQRITFKHVLPLVALFLIIIIALSSGTKGAAITEFELEEYELYDTEPYGIDVDDNTGTSYVLAALYGSDKIARLNPAGSMVDIIQLEDGSRPWDIVFDNRTTTGYSYRMWFTLSQRHQIGQLRLTAAGSWAYSEWALSADASPRGIASQYRAGQNPRLWFTEYGIGAIGTLVDLGGGSASIQEFYLPDSNSGPLDILYSDTTGVWFTEYQGHRIGNYNPATGEIREWPLPSGSYPWGIARDSYSNIWVSLSGRNRIAKLNPYTNQITEYFIPTPNAQPYEITVDRYNNVWFTEHAVNRIARFSPCDRTFIEFERTAVGAPFGITYVKAGEHEGTIWFSEEVGNRLGRIDDTQAKTTVTVSTKFTIATQSSTATTLGSSFTGTVSTETAQVTTSPSNITTTASTTSYKATETSSHLRTSQVALSTVTALYTGTTTSTNTSYVTTLFETTSVTGTETEVLTTSTSISATTTRTSYTATVTSTSTSTETSTVTVTSYYYSNAPEGGMIPGYPPLSIVFGLIVGFIILVASRFGIGFFKRFKWGGWLTVIFALALIVGASMLPAAQAAYVSEWRLAAGSTVPYGLTFDDQSPYRVWVAEFGSSKIARLDHTSNEIFEIVLPTTSQPWDIHFETSKNELWFTMPGRHRLGVIEGYGSSIYELVLPGGSQPRGLAVQEFVNGTADPYIWVALYGSDQIARVDPYAGQRIVYWNLITGAKPQSIIFVPETGIWFTEDGPTPGRIGNLNPATGEIKLWSVPYGGKAWDIVSDPNGIIWFTDYVNNNIGRLNTCTGEIILYKIPTSNSIPYGIAVDSNDDIWFAENNQNKIGRFSPDSVTFDEFLRTSGTSIWGLAIAPDGMIWFTDDSGHKIGRFNPNLVLATTTVSEISTASKSTSTEIPASTTIASSVATTVRSDVETTRTTAPTTLLTNYALNETIKVLLTTTTTSSTDFSTTTLTVLGDLTSTLSETISTVTTTNTTTKTSTLYSTTTLLGTSTSVNVTTATTTVTSTSTVTTAFDFSKIPGFSPISIVIGLLTGLAGLAVAGFRRIRK